MVPSMKVYYNSLIPNVPLPLSPKQEAQKNFMKIYKPQSNKPVSSKFVDKRHERSKEAYMK